jgi:hypothetical protein
MRKEAVNTFSKGVNMDLNPITTPADVLSDCVNGTFITFNGDEMALQNDAGNTKINSQYTSTGFITGTPYIKNQIVSFNGSYYIANSSFTSSSNPNVDTTNWTNINTYVKLKEGYYPIGLKEFGGVLYIVSSNGTNIEFGSYPSPQFSGTTEYDGSAFVKTETTSQLLYSPQVINSEVFKSGRYIKFSQYSSLDSTYISDYNTKRFYIVKLYHKLNNGLVDITSDVWSKYITYLTSNSITDYTNKYWFNDSGFVYYCPDQYKGNLVISLELEPLTQFNLYKNSTLDYINTGKYTTVNVASTTSFPSTGTVLIGTTLFTYTSKTATTFVGDSQSIDTSLIGVNVYGATKLAANISKSVAITSISVVNSSMLPSTGSIIVGGETIPYTANDTSTNTLTVSFTPVSDHVINSIVQGGTSTILTVALEGYYNYGFNVIAKTGTSDATKLYVNSIFVKLFLNGEQVQSQYVNTQTNGMFNVSFKLTESIYKDNIVTYSIVPNFSILLSNGSTFSYNSQDSSYESNFPIDYRNNYILSGSRTISTNIDNVKFVLERGTCDYATAYKTYKCITLEDANGGYLDNYLQHSDVEYVILKEGESVVGSQVLIGYYTIADDNTVVLDSTLTLPLSDSVKQSIERLAVSVSDDSCIATYYMIGTNIHIEDSEITIQQGTSTTTDDNNNTIVENGTTVPLSGESGSDYIKTAYLSPGKYVTITITKAGYEQIIYTKLVSATSDSLDFGLIAKVAGTLTTVNGVYTVGFSWIYAANAGTIAVNIYKGQLTTLLGSPSSSAQTNPSDSTLSYAWSATNGSTNIGYAVIAFPLYTNTVPYDNMSDYTAYTVINGTIFRHYYNVGTLTR